MKYVYSVDGNIGSGKNDLIEKLRIIFDKDSNVCIRKQPCFKWKTTQHSKTCSSNLLDLYYADTSRWAYTFETRCLISRIMDYKRSTKSITFCEKSWLSDRYVFCETLFDLGCMSMLEKELYDEYVFPQF